MYPSRGYRFLRLAADVSQVWKSPTKSLPWGLVKEDQLASSLQGTTRWPPIDHRGLSKGNRMSAALGHLKINQINRPKTLRLNFCTPVTTLCKETTVINHRTGSFDEEITSDRPSADAKLVYVKNVFSSNVFSQNRNVLHIHI